MKNIGIFILCTSAILFLAACGDETKESRAETVKNPVDTYLDSRVNAMDMAKESVKESNKQVDKQNKAMEALTR